MSSRATIGERSINTVPMATNQGFKNLVCKENMSNEFLYYTIGIIKNGLINLSGGSTFLEIGKREVENYKIAYPSLSEQKKIASILSSVDEHIEEIENIIEDLKELKKGLMQKLLTGQYIIENGKLIKTKEFKKTKLGMLPKHWEVRRLKETSDEARKNSFIDGDWIKSKYILDSGIRLIQTGNIGLGKFIDKEDKKYISEEAFKELKCKEVEPGDILICRLAEPTGRSCIVPDLKKKMITSVDIVIFKVENSKYSPYFINYYLNTYSNLKYVGRYEQGSTRKRISRKNLEGISIPIPPLHEQQKIASILSTVDERIESYQEQKEDYQQLKKGLMQQLLTGKIRVKTES